MPIFGWRTLFALGGALSLAVGAVLMRYLPESPRYLARHPHRWAELERILRQIGHAVPAGSRFVDLGEKAVARASVGALFTPDFRRDTLVLWGAMFACMLAVYTAFNWVPTMLNGAGLGLRVAGNGLAAFNLGGVVGAICGGLVIARIGSKPTMLTIAAAAVCGAVALALTPITATASALPIVALLGFTGAAINAHPDDALCPCRPRLPDRRARDWRWHRGRLRPRRRRPQHLRRRVGDWRRRQRCVLRAHGNGDGRGLPVPRARLAARAAARPPRRIAARS